MAGSACQESNESIADAADAQGRIFGGDLRLSGGGDDLGLRLGGGDLLLRRGGAGGGGLLRLGRGRAAGGGVLVADLGGG